MDGHDILLTKLEHYSDTLETLEMIGLSLTYLTGKNFFFNKWPSFKPGFCFVCCTSRPGVLKLWPVGQNPAHETLKSGPRVLIFFKQQKKLT